MCESVTDLRKSFEKKKFSHEKIFSLRISQLSHSRAVLVVQYIDTYLRYPYYASSSTAVSRRRHLNPAISPFKEDFLSLAAARAFDLLSGLVKVSMPIQYL